VLAVALAEVPQLRTDGEPAKSRGERVRGMKAKKRK
jgi:hypothetical protein